MTPAVTSPIRARWIMRLLACAAIISLGAGPIQAQTTGFDLAGPSLRVTVTHGGVTLPLSQVPNLSVGDRLRIAADLPAAQGARYRMVFAFLRGATNPPPKDWLFDAETWKPKKATIDVVVPEGAGQAVVLLVPDTGGATGAVASAIRSRPGAFVRASQELNQAMLDRARLETFVDYVTRRGSSAITDVSPQLARSLAVKLDTDCLQRQPDARAACLTQGSNAAVQADSQTSSIAQTLSGTPADIALQLSSTPQAGFGYYSPYIGVIRDVARLLGAFQSAQLQFIPALTVQHGDTTALLLNAVPSFRKPQSVLVAALPAVVAPTLPPLAAVGDAPLCASRPELVLPVTGAPLVFATAYAREMTLRMKSGDGRVLEVPVAADPARGGYVLGAVAGAAFGRATEGHVHGLWGFQPFDGPTFYLVAPGGREWRPAEADALVVGRDTPLRLDGGAAACVAEVTVEHGGEPQPVAWTAQGQDGLSLKVPLTNAEPGPVVITVRSYGVDTPQRLQLRAFAEASHITAFELHAGDRQGVLTGSRLDQVAALDIAGVAFRPGALERAKSSDRLPMMTDMAAVGTFQSGQIPDAKVTLHDGRSVALRVSIGAPRPDVGLVGKSSERPGPVPALSLTLLPGDDLVSQDARLVFSLRAQGETRMTAKDTVDIEATDTAQTISLPLRLQDARVGIASFVPAAALGDSAHGPLRFRLVQNGVAGDWQTLATLVRLPTLTDLRCPAAPDHCVLGGTGLFLIRSVSNGSGAQGITVPDGFTGTTIEVPRPTNGQLNLSLRDLPQAVASVRLPQS